jgi:hypothetical protein
MSLNSMGLVNVKDRIAAGVTMSLIEDFFLDKDRIRKVLSDKIKNELPFDIPARRALERVSPQGKDALLKWFHHYKILRSLPKEETSHSRSNLVDAIIKDAANIRRDLTFDSIIDRHSEISKLCNSVEGVKAPNKDGDTNDRSFRSLASKLLWLLYPTVVPIYDAQAWHAITVIARLANKVETPDPAPRGRNSILDEYCAFLKLHRLCFSTLYEPIDKIVAEDFGSIFDGVPTMPGTSIKKEDAEQQYANHITVIDQLLWHLGNDVPVADCLKKRVGTTKK